MVEFVFDACRACTFTRHECRYCALIECPDGETYTQGYDEFEDLINLYNSLGDGFSIQEIY